MRVAVPVRAVVAAASALIPAGPAVADGGGGGAAAPHQPTIARARCVSEHDLPCAGGRGLTRERPARVSGGGLETARLVLFLGRRGARDDVSARPSETSERQLTVTVPANAATGAIGVVTKWGARAKSEAPVRLRDAPTPEPVDVAPSSRFFYGGHRRPSFAVDAPSAMEVTVELVHSDTGELVRTWTVPAQAGQRLEVAWDGTGERGVERSGTYRFQLDATAVASATVAPEATGSFTFADHLFPIRGKHDLGNTTTNQFGGGRGHQGVDMFAACGTRLAAARGGRVQYAGYHARAGYYVVIDGNGTGVDYVYMHMNAPALVKTGQRVFTGQKIGEAGDTGNADGCHLHFEMWSAPGWYEGGKPFDPRPSLAAWDSYS